MWNAPTGCPTRENVLAEMAQVLAGARGERVHTMARADVVLLDSGLWSMRLSVDTGDAHSERQFKAETCAEAASAAALILAVSIEGDARVAVPPGPAVAKRSEPGRGPSVWASQLIATAAGLVDAGMMPNAPAPGVEASLGWSLASSKLRLRALAGLATEAGQRAAIGSGAAGGHFSLVTVSARACSSIARGRFDAGPCLGGEFESMSASGVGPVATFQPTSAHRVWGAIVGGVIGAWTYSRAVAIFARGEAIFSLAETRFVLTPDNTAVHRPSRWAGRAAIGIELRFF